ncbi:MAG: UDP-glucose/GDP-mannose dehydrogenase family protein [Proteobacteria bacterium]|nr:UDP-glucose/GDP-mannose dehydrogenase family protein [Pseudomonadota bacterium]
MHVVTIGTGYVGINTAAALAYIGHSVWGVDVDAHKIALLKGRKAPISEAGLDDLLSLPLDLRFTTALSECIQEADVIFIAVGTPSLPNGEANLAYVMSAAEDIGQTLRPGHDVTIVVKSTVPVGVNEMLERKIRDLVKENGGNVDYLHFASNPEFLREGTALFDTFYPDRFVIGTRDDVAFNTLHSLFEPIIAQKFEMPAFIEAPAKRPETQCLRTDQISAEMIKYASNVFLALKISYANEIAGLVEKLGGNMADISRGMGMDKRIAPYFLQSGLGWGGSCFPKDSLALLSMAKDYDYEMPIVQAAVDVNERQKARLVQKVLSKLHTLSGKRIALFGLTFKPRTDDVRNSPAVDIARELMRRGAIVVAHDPEGLALARVIYKDDGFIFCDEPEKSADGADALIIATEWPFYRTVDWARIHNLMRAPILFDARNLLRENKDLVSGFDYTGL